MKTVYLVWRNPQCNGNNPEWEQLTGQEFYAIVSLSENKERCFVKLLKAGEDDVDVVMETTKAEYVKWRKEKAHSNYLRECQNKSGYQAVSYHDFESVDGYYGEDILHDERYDKESECLKERMELSEALSQLSAEERHIVDYFYLSDKKGTVRGYELLTGIPKSTINRRKLAVLAKLKKFLMIKWDKLRFKFAIYK